MSEVIVVTSGKGGVGKTTTTANVGTGLAAMGKRVVLIDTDIGLRNLDVVMGLENRIVYNLVDVVEGNCRVKQALIKDKRYPGLYLLPSAQTRDKTAVNESQMIKHDDASGRFQDLPPFQGAAVKSARIIPLCEMPESSLHRAGIDLIVLLLLQNAGHLQRRILRNDIHQPVFLFRRQDASFKGNGDACVPEKGRRPAELFRRRRFQLLKIHFFIQMQADPLLKPPDHNRISSARFRINRLRPRLPRYRLLR